MDERMGWIERWSGVAGTSEGERSPFPDGELVDGLEVGAVHERGARVWVRRPGRTRVEGWLEVDGCRVEGSVELSAATDWTGALDLALPAPAPGRPFVVRVDGQERRGRLAPLPGARAALTFAFGSCNLPFRALRDGQVVYNRAAGLYPAMVADLEAAGAAFVLLVGDQVYADGLAPVSVRAELRRSGEREPSFHAALEAYRRVYRGYLGQAGFRALRERFPTCCMWDDHDIFNNWGSLLEETPLDRLMFAAACRAFVEYQHPRNPADPRVGPPFHFTFAWGDVGFLVLDLRGARDYESGHLLGRAQCEEVRLFLAGEAASRVQTLFVVSSVPLAHTARWVARLFSRLHERAANSVRDRWSSDAFVGARDALLDALLAWQAAAPGRQVIALSGDIHEASAWTIRPRRGPGAIKQFTSSALTNVPPRKQVALNWAVGLAPNLLEPRYRFERHFLRSENNFGLVQVTPLDGPGHRVDLQVRGWDPERGALRTVAHRVCLPAPPYPAGRPTP